MTHGNQYLGKLYNDLITNSPQTISMDIPSDMGQGRIAQTKTKHGVILSDWQMCYQSDMNVQGPVSREYIQIIFCMNDGISWGIMNEHRSVTIQKTSPVFMQDTMAQNISAIKRTVTFHLKALKFRFYIFRSFFLTILMGKKLPLTKKNF